jgi:hypothetical protein
MDHLGQSASSAYAEIFSLRRAPIDLRLMRASMLI